MSQILVSFDKINFMFSQFSHSFPSEDGLSYKIVFRNGEHIEVVGKNRKEVTLSLKSFTKSLDKCMAMLNKDGVK
jgi:hypothetical protein